ncbi:MAG: helix-turn-helix domain-containing protein [Firmicutes bacterium]|nr:helix-turn-helix domain-containing protein [Bacillota bacterium]
MKAPKVKTPTFGKILGELMKKHNTKQQDLADSIGVYQGNISNWLHDNSAPGYFSIIKLCKYFNVTADYLLDIDDKKQ